VETGQNMSSFSESQALEEFNLIDRNRDGRITLDELAAFLKTLGFNSKNAEEILEEINMDENSHIDKDEYIGYMKKKRNAMEWNEHDVFKKMDKDESGVISAAELNHVLADQGIYIEDEEVDKMLHLVDTDGDGKINFEEFKKFAEKNAVQRKIEKAVVNPGVSDLWSSVNHVAIVVSDIGRSCAFYGGVLGMEQIMRPDFDRHGAWFTLGNVDLHLIKGRPAVHSDEDLIVGHIALNVGREEDMERLMERLEKLGVKYRENISVPNPDSDLGRVVQTFVRDPDGYYLEFCSCDGLHEYLESRAASQQHTLNVESLNTAIYMRQFLKSWASKAGQDVVVDESKLTNLLARQKIYGDITQSASPLQLRELLKLYDNDIPSVMKALRDNANKQGGRTFIPPAFYERDRSLFQPKAFKIEENTEGRELV